MCTRATDSPIGHGVTDFRNFFDFKADVIDEFDVTFIVNRPFESSEARIDVDNDPFFYIPVEEWGEMGRYMWSRSYWRSVSWQWWICHGEVDYAGVDNQWFRSKIIEFF